MISLNPLQPIPTIAPLPGKAPATELVGLPGIADPAAADFSLVIGKIDQTAASVGRIARAAPVKHGDRGFPVRFPDLPGPPDATVEIPTAVPTADPTSPHDSAQPADQDASTLPLDDPAVISRSPDLAQFQLAESPAAALPLPAPILSVIPSSPEITAADLSDGTRQGSARDQDTTPSPTDTTSGSPVSPKQGLTRHLPTQTLAPATTSAAVSMTPEAWSDDVSPAKPMAMPPGKIATADTGAETGNSQVRTQPTHSPRAETRLSGDQTSVVGIGLTNIRLPGSAQSLPTAGHRPLDRISAMNPDHFAPTASPVVKTREFSTDQHAPLAAPNTVLTSLPTRLPDRNDASVRPALDQNTLADLPGLTPSPKVRAAPTTQNSQPALPTGPILPPDKPGPDPSQSYRTAHASQLATFPPTPASDPATRHPF